MQIESRSVGQLVFNGRELRVKLEEKDKAKRLVLDPFM